MKVESMGRTGRKELGGRRTKKFTWFVELSDQFHLVFHLSGLSGVSGMSMRQ